MGGMGVDGNNGRDGQVEKIEDKKRGPPRMKFMKALQGVIRFLFCAYILLYIM